MISTSKQLLHVGIKIFIGSEHQHLQFSSTRPSSSALFICFMAFVIPFTVSISGKETSLQCSYFIVLTC